MTALERTDRKLTVQVFLERRRSGEIWVPYKTFIGFRRGRWVVIADRAEHLYDTREFDSRDAAVSAASRRARAMIGGKFPEYGEEDLDWDVVEEGSPVGTGGRSASSSNRPTVRDGQAESPSLHS